MQTYTKLLALSVVNIAIVALGHSDAAFAQCTVMIANRCIDGPPGNFEGGTPHRASSGQGIGQPPVQRRQFFGGMGGTVAVEAPPGTWGQLSQEKTACIDQGLRINGSSVQQLIQSGIAPSDPRIRQVANTCDRLFSRPLRKNFPCPMQIARTQFSSFCNEEFARPDGRGGFVKLTFQDAVSESFQGRTPALVGFERIDAQNRRQQMQQAGDLSTQVVSPNFDCAKAHTETEFAVCNSDELSSLDGLYGEYYRQVRPFDKKGQAEREVMRLWRIGNDCRGSYVCIRDNLAHGIDFEGGILKSHGIPASTFAEIQAERNQRIEAVRNTEQERMRQAQAESTRSQQRADDERRLALAQAEAEKAKAEAETAKAQAERAKAEAEIAKANEFRDAGTKQSEGIPVLNKGLADREPSNRTTTPHDSGTRPEAQLSMDNNSPLVAHKETSPVVPYANAADNPVFEAQKPRAEADANKAKTEDERAQSNSAAQASVGSPEHRILNAEMDNSITVRKNSLDEQIEALIEKLMSGNNSTFATTAIGLFGTNYIKTNLSINAKYCSANMLINAFNNRDILVHTIETWDIFSNVDAARLISSCDMARESEHSNFVKSMCEGEGIKKNMVELHGYGSLLWDETIMLPGEPAHHSPKRDDKNDAGSDIFTFKDEKAAEEFLVTFNALRALCKDRAPPSSFSELIQKQWRIRSHGNSTLVPHAETPPVTPSTTAVNDPSSQLCESYIRAISEIGFSMRSRGAPISIAEDILYRYNIDDYRLRTFLYALLHSIYENPESSREIVDSGKALAACAKEVRGF